MLPSVNIYCNASVEARRIGYIISLAWIGFCHRHIISYYMPMVFAIVIMRQILSAQTKELRLGLG